MGYVYIAGNLKFNTYKYHILNWPLLTNPLVLLAIIYEVELARYLEGEKKLQEERKLKEEKKLEEKGGKEKEERNIPKGPRGTREKRERGSWDAELTGEGGGGKSTKTGRNLNLRSGRN